MDDPKEQMETAAIQKRGQELAKQKLDEEKKKLEKQLKEKAGDALKKLFKEPYPASDHNKNRRSGANLLQQAMEEGEARMPSTGGWARPIQASRRGQARATQHGSRITVGTPSAIAGAPCHGNDDVWRAGSSVRQNLWPNLASTHIPRRRQQR